jgi:hypothetical protein
MFRTALALLLLAEANNVVDAERYNMHLFGEASPYIDTGSGSGNKIRFLQSSEVNTPDLLAPEDICTVNPPYFQCADTVRIDADDLTFADVTVSFSCFLDAQTGFDYRRSRDCQCTATIVPSETDRLTKTCPCSICPQGFGDSPIAIDCTKYDEDPDETGIDPFVIDKCSSLDCGFACNGTCAFDCQEAGEECRFCANNTEPTSAPTGSCVTEACIAECDQDGDGDCDVTDNQIAAAAANSKNNSSAFLHSHGTTTLLMLLAGAAWMAL